MPKDKVKRVAEDVVEASIDTELNKIESEILQLTEDRSVLTGGIADIDDRLVDLNAEQSEFEAAKVKVKT